MLSKFDHIISIWMALFFSSYSHLISVISYSNSYLITSSIYRNRKAKRTLPSNLLSKRAPHKHLHKYMSNFVFSFQIRIDSFSKIFTTFIGYTFCVHYYCSVYSNRKYVVVEQDRIICRSSYWFPVDCVRIGSSTAGIFISILCKALIFPLILPICYNTNPFHLMLWMCMNCLKYIGHTCTIKFRSPLVSSVVVCFCCCKTLCKATKPL